jgi:peroxiredoxin Q/BCP
MRIQFLIWLFVSLSMALPGLAFAAPEIGDPAPDFSMQGSDGNTYSLQQLVGNSGIVIAFFPKAFTGG